ncbi:hypothetical protein ACAX46_004354 [Providencia rettgeri]
MPGIVPNPPISTVSGASLQLEQSGIFTMEHGRIPFSRINESIVEWSREVVPGEDRHAVARKILEASHDRQSNKLDLSNLQITTLPQVLPDNIKVLNVSGCSSLTKIEPSTLNNLERLNITGCTALINTQFPDGLEVIR